MSVTVIKDTPNARQDIVFVHGLKTETEAWTSAETSVFWPATLLPAQVPDARILKYDYEDATLDSFFNEEDLVSEISDELVSELMGERRGDLAERPVIFVAHCLGGLVVENALLRASQHPKKKTLINSIHGILLLGTPHYTPETLPEATKYFQLAQQRPPSSLPAKSHFILQIPEQFTQFLQQTPVKIECFYEGAATKVPNADGCDELIKLVDVSMASIPDSPPATRLSGNHYQISRFSSPTDKDFKKVYRVLQGWVEELPEREEKGVVNNVSHASFAGSTNSGYQLGQNVGSQTGFVFGR